jgi:hypothetical protein
MPQSNRKYDPSIHEMLDKADWDTVFLKVLDFAVLRARNFRWLGVEVDPEALVQEAIARAYGIGTRGNYRNWNPETCPDLAMFLNGIIRSMTSHMAEHEAGFPTESFFNEDGSFKDDRVLKSIDDTGGAFKSKTPEDLAVEKENFEALIVELDRLSEKDDDLGLVVLALEEGVSKPRHIAEATGLEISKVNNALKKIRRNLSNISPKMKMKPSTERKE